jgi:rRNA biogenesis protein RRP5
LAIASDVLPEIGSIVKGFIANVSPKGCFIRLSSLVTAVVFLKDLSDDFIEKPVDAFPIGKLVEGRLLAFNPVDNTAKVTLKPSKVHGDERTMEELNSLSVGDTVNGRVQRVADIGVFVEISGTSLVGLSRKAMAIQDENGDLRQSFEIGDVVQAKVLSVNISTQKIGLGLKPSFFKHDDENEDEEDEDVAEESDEEAESEAEEDNSDGVIRMLGSDDENSDDEEMQALLRNASVQERDDSDESEAEGASDVPLAKKSKKIAAKEIDSDVSSKCMHSLTFHHAISYSCRVIAISEVVAFFNQVVIRLHLCYQTHDRCFNGKIFTLRHRSI